MEQLSGRLLEQPCPGTHGAHRRRPRRKVDLRSGTFTLNNYGVFGVDGSTAIINHPEVGILGVGRIIEKP